MRTLAVVLAGWMVIAAGPLSAQQMLNIVVVEGEGAINNIRQRTARETIVQVEDENHKPVAGAVVVFSLPSEGAGGSFASGAQMLTVTTDAQGRAVARGLRINKSLGRWQMRVNASFGNQTAVATIAQTNAVGAAVGGAAAGAAATGISAKTIAIIAIVVGAAATGGAVAAVKASGGGGTTAPTTIAAGAGSVGAPK